MLRLEVDREELAERRAANPSSHWLCRNLGCQQKLDVSHAVYLEEPTSLSPVPRMELCCHVCGATTTLPDEVEKHLLAIRAQVLQRKAAPLAQPREGWPFPCEPDTSLSTKSLYVGVHHTLVADALRLALLAPRHVMLHAWIALDKDPKTALSRARATSRQDSRVDWMLFRADFTAVGIGHYIATNMLTTCDMNAWRFHGEMPMPVSMNAAGEPLASIECCEGWEDLQRGCSERVDRKEHPPST